MFGSRRDVFPPNASQPPKSVPSLFPSNVSRKVEKRQNRTKGEDRAVTNQICCPSDYLCPARGALVTRPASVSVPSAPGPSRPSSPVSRSIARQPRSLSLSSLAGCPLLDATYWQTASPLFPDPVQSPVNRSLLSDHSSTGQRGEDSLAGREGAPFSPIWPPHRTCFCPRRPLTLDTLYWGRAQFGEISQSHGIFSLSRQGNACPSLCKLLSLSHFWNRNEPIPTRAREVLPIFHPKKFLLFYYYFSKSATIYLSSEMG